MGRSHRTRTAIIPIADPLAGHRLTKKIGEFLGVASGKNQIIYGIKDCVKAIKKDQRGLVLLGGNVTPMDVITHIPVLCEEHKVDYCFLPTKEQMAAYANRTSPVACVMIKLPAEEADLEMYNAIVAEIKEKDQE